VTLFEVTAALTVMTLGAVTVGMGLQSGSLAAREVRDSLRVQAQAQNLLALINTLNIGQVSDPDPKKEQLDELFDGDADPGDISVHQLTRYKATDDGWSFTLAGFEAGGEWTVQADYDLDGDGFLLGAIPATIKGDLLKAAESSLDKTLQKELADRVAREIIATGDSSLVLRASLELLATNTLEQAELTQRAIHIRVLFNDRLVLRSIQTQEATP